ncbi:LIM and senescent cell antigen-like-containing domain protein 2 isoform X2 [Rousettus aegyptiacus]|uniref:LIM and senescent cell antigen-like-containing domain protein 2 isoform X2 n=1 Tax=Rousettus aegyptiacus TaxID=9407 RepID=UPI00168D6A15|nr:LIM and senescent cell antigen-like-containing domain protein 2 isoform X2 [Rousettus aegyptiacus]
MQPAPCSRMSVVRTIPPGTVVRTEPSKLSGAKHGARGRAWGRGAGNRGCRVAVWGAACVWACTCTRTAGPAQTRNGIGQACCSVENLNLSRSSNSSEWTGTLLLCFWNTLGVCGNMSNALANAVCQRCQARFTPAERIVNSNGELYHEHCFVCAQCFRPFPEGLFYEFEGRKYCEHDFQMLFAPCCGSCGEFIIGRVIKAMNNNWHPGCFRCELCDVELADLGFVKNAGRHLCRPCHNREKAKGLGKHICQRCHLVIEEQPLMFRSDAYHPDHFSCTHCRKELTSEARELKGELYCLPCHDKMGVPICGACRRPIEGRVVNALGKQWHVEHFVCAKCEKPFLGHRHYEKKGLAYCETHYNQVRVGDQATALG